MRVGPPRSSPARTGGLETFCPAPHGFRVGFPVTRDVTRGSGATAAYSLTNIEEKRSVRFETFQGAGKSLPR
ncbi:hypothetical protein GCM10027186_08370 [Micromonospora schwarzwaldensis]